MGGTMPCSCLRLLIKPGHRSKILPTAAPRDNRGLSAGRTAQEESSCCVFCVYTSPGNVTIELSVNYS